MKKIFILLLIVLCFVGCGKKKERENVNFINKTKSEALVESIQSYITMAKYEVNSGKYNIYDESTLYLIPAGDNKNKSCIMSDMRSYGDWEYLYIGILYDDYLFKYYAIGEDKDGRGIDFTESSLLEEDIVYNSYKMNKDGYNILFNLYNKNGNNAIYEPIDETGVYQKLYKLLSMKEYKRIVVVGSKNCES